MDDGEGDESEEEASSFRLDMPDRRQRQHGQHLGGGDLVHSHTAQRPCEPFQTGPPYLGAAAYAQASTRSARYILTSLARSKVSHSCSRPITRSTREM